MPMSSHPSKFEIPCWLFNIRIPLLCALFALCASPPSAQAQQSASPQQLAKWLALFPEADTDKDGTLSVEEALAYRAKIEGRKEKASGGGAPRTFEVDPGWDADRFPEHAVSYRSPEEILAAYKKAEPGAKQHLVSFPKPDNGALRIVGTGHSFMAPGYKTLPVITEAAGFEQPLHTHTGGGMTGSSRYKWEQENGIFQFDGKPVPKLLASIANAEWDAMMWGPYFNDRPEYYTCWIDFCLQYHPGMKFYLSDAWPQLYQIGDEIPTSEDIFTIELFDKLGAEKRAIYMEVISGIRETYPDKIFIMPTSDAMTLAAQAFLRGELPGVEGVHKAVGKKEHSLWKDPLGHLGPGFERLEGYVFYATLYGRSPALIENEIDFGPGDFPGPDLDKIFRKLAWQAVTHHPFSGVIDANNDGVNDSDRPE